MTVGHWLAEATAKLTAVGIATAHLDALVLMEDCTQIDRAQLLAHPELELKPSKQKTLDLQIGRRVLHEPLSYIRNKTEFYGREFYIDHRVLEPRPESETMIDLLKALPFTPATAIIDVGTGSGAIAITVKLELPYAKVMAIDIDAGSLNVARQNAEALEVDVQFIKGDLLRPLYTHYRREKYILLCNLPYVPNGFQVNPAALQEPHIAIFGGADGLDLYRKLFEQIDPLVYKPRLVLTECLPPQQDALAAIARTHGYSLRQTEDFIQVFEF
ncbi:MAG TPA: HemK/PrmC family methyltransferase [Candidatus Saccharimonadales bacterium]|nr:HemK/PrmC family methyltransferase [Candidatus Saccharimonadales bacterium]